MLERLSWKRLVFELILCCIPALILGLSLAICRGFTGGRDGIARLAFLEFTASFRWLWVDRSMTPRREAGAGNRYSTACTRCRCVTKAPS